MSVPRLLVLTDRSQLPAGRTLDDSLRDCVAAGAGWFVVRELDLPRPDRQRLVARLAEVTGATVLSAREALPGSAGVHLSATDTELMARGVPLHGRSCHDVGEVRRAVDGGAAYVTLSPVAESASKPGYGPPLTDDVLRRAVRAALGVPVLALGGVTPGNAARWRSLGLHGVAVMGAVMRAERPGDVVRSLLAEVGP